MATIETTSRYEKDLEIARYEGVLIGLEICKKMWAQGTISHREITENKIYYTELLKELE